MKIGIIGAGALGSLFGGYLTADDQNVVMVDIWEELVESINRDGIVIEPLDGREVHTRPRAVTDPMDAEIVDIAFVMVKAIHTESAIENAKPMIDDETVVVTFQNGLKNLDILNRILPKHTVLTGATHTGGKIQGLGHIREVGGGGVKVGGENKEAAGILGKLLSSAGFDVTIVGDPTTHIWNKQILNIGTKPVAALTGLPDGPLAEHEDTSAVMENLVREAEAIAESKGIKIHGDPIKKLYELCEMHYDTKPSMLKDIENERRTEIDHINGAIVEFGNHEDIPTPFNWTITKLVKGRERSYLSR